MSTKYLVENLLRPPVEMNSAVVAILFSVILFVAPGVIMLTPSVTYFASFLLFVLAIVRYRQARRIKKYQRGLKKLPYYEMSSKQVPVSTKKLFLGKGFRWRSKHTQRLKDIHRNNPDKYLEPSMSYRFARWLEDTFETNPVIKPITKLTSSKSRMNPLKPLPDVGGSPEIHAVGMWEGEKDIYSKLGERVGHTLVLGTTRVGKTRLAELLITQDIKRGDVTIVFDPKGDAALMRRVYGEAISAGRKCYIFHLGYPDISARYNPVGEFSRITEVAGRIADQLPSEGNSAAFKMFGWRFVNIIAQALVRLGERPDYHKISRHILSIDNLFIRYAKHVFNERKIKDWATATQVIQDNLDEKTLPFALKGRDFEGIAIMKYLETSEVYDSVLDGLMGAFRYDKTYFDKIVSSLAPLLEQLTSGRTAELLAPEYSDVNDNRPIFDWKSVIQQKAVVYVGLDCLSDSVVGGAIGASMFADLTSVAGHLYKNGLDHGLADGLKATEMPKISLHADEFNELVGDQFIPMLNKAGGAGFQVTAYTQTISDIVAGIGDVAKAGQIEGNFNTTIMMRVLNKETAQFFTDKLPEVEINSLTAITSASDSSDTSSDTQFDSRNEDRITEKDVKLVSEDVMMALPKGQAFAMLEGGQLYKLRLPMPNEAQDRKDKILPDNLAAIADDMERGYLPITSEDWYSSNDFGWFNAGELNRG
ncbi:type IV conjugative transfer system coupling protein TraD [uncultured Cocleimonas sp.]|jgi:conjugative coupling factor TraD (TOL family)|uniref:type IV conjugative transfer system coupling protein TraD n=1 Tax=uncultured Cocleimonas sp. TaxID=1051587 RepID=UPI0026228073|nr:type IV conjugative transfer system coupling protein TraD [uncultured Cocleimonas sp.]